MDQPRSFVMQLPAQGGRVLRMSALMSAGLMCIALWAWGPAAMASSQAWVQQTVAAAAPGSAGGTRATAVGNFGAAVAVDGATAFVGAPFSATAGHLQQGAVYVFTKNADRTWQQSGLLLADDGGAYDQFGSVVARVGDYLMIGAPGATVGGNTARGAVYVFSDSSGSWAQVQKLVAADGSAGDEFGAAVALGNGHLLVGARYAKVGSNAQQGAVYDFTLSSGSWSQVQKLVAGDGSADDLFGAAVVMDGTMALVGASGAAVNGEALRGAVYAYNYTNNAWSESGKLVAGDGVAGDLFGSALAFDAGHALIGAPAAGTAADINRGKVYAYEQAGTSLSQVGMLSADDGVSGDKFGHAIAMQGDKALVGTLSGNGKIYLFSLDGGQWLQSVMFNGGQNAGRSLALQGRLLLAGVPVGGGGSVNIYVPVNLSLTTSAPAKVKPGEQMSVNSILTNNAATVTPPLKLLTFTPDASTNPTAVPTQGECNRDAAFVCSFDGIAGNGGSAKVSVKFEVTKAAAASTLTNTIGTVNVVPSLEASAATRVQGKQHNDDGGGGALTLGVLAFLALFSLVVVLRERR